MNTVASRFVVVAVDGSPDGRRAIHYGVLEALRRGVGLRLVHVREQTVPTAVMLATLPAETLDEIAAGVVKDAEQEARRSGWTEPELDVVLADGPRRQAILEHADDAVILVVGRRSSTVDHLLTGSTTSSLVAHSDVPVISVPESWSPEEQQRGLVVAGVDYCGCEEAHDVVAVALEEALSRKARLELVHAWRPTGAYDALIGSRVLEEEWSVVTRRQLDEQVRGDGRSSTVRWSVSARYERPAIALQQASRQADLVVVGRHGHASRVHRFVGSTTRAVLRSSSCPVLVVPAEMHATRQ